MRAEQLEYSSFREATKSDVSYAADRSTGRDGTQDQAIIGGGPKVSIGLPVYNGGAYLEAALESILSQTFEDFELIISDNASTDETQEVCKRFERTDHRIRYVRQSSNVGASKNFNDVFASARGTYFKWAAHDDILERTFIEKCVDILDRYQDVVICHSKVMMIDSKGSTIGPETFELDKLDDQRASRRLAAVVLVNHLCTQVFGLARREALAHTSLIQPYPNADRVLLADLALRGRLYEVPEHLFLSRDHPHRSIRAIPIHWRQKWFSPDNADGPTMPHWQTLGGYVAAIGAARLSVGERLLCYGQLIRWLGVNANIGRLAADLTIRTMPSTWPLFERLRKRLDP